MDSYWEEHYSFGRKWKTGGNVTLGRSSRQSILINVVAPVQYAFSLYLNDPELKERAVGLLSEIPAECNRVIRKWKDTGITPSNAADSQALLTLFHDFCVEKRCFDCSIGKYLLGIR